MLDNRIPASETLKFDVSTVSIKGSRDYQEDSVLSSFPIGQPLGYAVISDGLGGHDGGNVASALATTEVYKLLKTQEAEIENGVANIPVMLREAAHAANGLIGAHSGADSDMGCTLLVPIIRGNKLYWISVGDSILLLFRGGALRRLNKDHSMAPQIDLMAKAGSLDAEAARNHPDRNVLTSVINGSEIEMIDCPTSSLKLQQGDVLIAASDGIQCLSSAVLANTLMQSHMGTAYEISNALLQEIYVLNDSDQDNTSFVVVKMESPQSEIVVDADDLPVLAMAEDTISGAPAAAAPKVEQPAEPKKDESKAYWYRGRKYYKD